MTYRHLLAAGLLSIGGWALSAAAQADTVLYDGMGFMTGTQSFTDSFNLPTAGVVTVTLTDVAWPDQLASLNFLLASSSGPSGPEMGAGTEAFNVKAGDFFAQWFGTAQGPLDAGVFALKISYLPAGATPVPLPTSLALLLSGLGLMIWQRRSRPKTQAGGYNLSI